MPRTGTDGESPHEEARDSDDSGSLASDQSWAGIWQIVSLICFCILAWLAVIGAILLFL